jgi:hypothetical protein
LQQRKRGQKLGHGRNTEIKVHFDRDSVARGGGSEIGWEIKTKHVARLDVSGNKANAKQL